MANRYLQNRTISAFGIVDSFSWQLRVGGYKRLRVGGYKRMHGHLNGIFKDNSGGFSYTKQSSGCIPYEKLCKSLKKIGRKKYAERQ